MSAPIPEPIRNGSDALGALSVAVSRPFRDEIVFMAIDGADRAGIVHRVPGPHSPDHVVGVVEKLADSAVAARVSSLVVASVRPRGGLLPGDVDRWLEASDAAEARGTRLLEWFVISPRGIECPRDLLGEPERWSHSVG